MSEVTSDGPTVVELSRRAANLTRSFAASALFYVLTMLAPAIVGLPTTPRNVAITALLYLGLLGSYVWYAIAAGLAARTLGGPGWKYVTWILAAPFVAEILSLMDIPILPTLVSASPLSIKFLLGNQFEEALRKETSMNLSRID